MSTSDSLGTLTGVIAALLVPRTDSGAPDTPALERNVAAVLASGVDGLSIGGATGEYAQQDDSERRELLAYCGSEARRAGRAFIPAIGAGHLHQSLALAELAAGQGAIAALLPPPLFFRYDQQDLYTFYAEAARLSPVPVLIYNLPSFVSPVTAETALALLDAGVAGIKDSSGQLDILSAYTSSQPRPKRFVGNDAALLSALQLGVCDGAVSGVAGVLPELLIAVLDKSLRPHGGALLTALLQKADLLPAPWSLKVIAEARGWGQARFPFPASPARLQQIRDLRAWLDAHLLECTSALSSPPVPVTD